MAEQDFLQNTGTLETPTNKAQAISKLMGSDKGDNFEDLLPKPTTADKEKSEAAAKKANRQETLKLAIQALQTKKKSLHSYKATGAIKYQREKRPGQPLPPNPSRFYAPDTTFGVDDGVRRLGRFPMGAGLKYNLPPLVSTNAQGQARATLKIKSPPMFGGL